MNGFGSSLASRILFVLVGVGVAVIGLVILIFAIDPTVVYGAVSRLVVSDDRLEPGAFIYVLNGRIEPRVAYAARLYDRGLAPRILIPQTREMARRPDRPLSNLIAAEIVAMGVPESAVAIVPFDGGVVDTRDEGRALRQYLEAEPVGRVIVVTMDYHSARARRTLTQELRGLDVELSMAGASDPRLFTPEDWWTTPRGRETYLGELVKLAGTVILGIIPWI